MKTAKLPEPSGRHIDYDADKEPTSDIELLGAMLTDNTTMGALLRELPYERTHYRSNLRMIAGAAIRTRQRCERLLGEDKRPGEELTVEEKAAAYDEYCREEGLATAHPIIFAAPAAKEAFSHSSVDLEPGTVIRLGDAAEQTREAIDHTELANDPRVRVEDIQAPAPSEPVRKRRGVNPTQPGKNGREYTVVESFIMSTLKERGASTTQELLRIIAEERRVPTVEINNALGDLRVRKLITTDRMGRGFINRIAE